MQIQVRPALLSASAFWQDYCMPFMCLKLRQKPPGCQVKMFVANSLVKQSKACSQRAPPPPVSLQVVWPWN